MLVRLYLWIEVDLMEMKRGGIPKERGLRGGVAVMKVVILRRRPWIMMYGFRKSLIIFSRNGTR